MESRKITIVSTKTQKKSVIMSGAETLAELKSDLREAGIDYTDMTFYEGVSKTELKTDESVLPKDVPYTNRTTGETTNTNELVFMLTNPNKKIKSGAASRKEIYDIIKKLNLQQVCINKYGKNYTLCSTSDLVALIDSVQVKAQAPVEEAPADKAEEKPVVNSNEDIEAREAIFALVDILVDNDVIAHYEADTVKDILLMHNSSNRASSENYKPGNTSPYSDNEIEKMFANM